MKPAVPIELAVLPISEAERKEVLRFSRLAEHQYHHFDFPPSEAFSWPGYAARDTAGQLLGVLGCRIDRPPIASILYAALDGRASGLAVLPALLAPNLTELRRASAEQITFIGRAPWLASPLRRAGFHQHTTVISYERWGWKALPEVNPDVTLRDARPDDAATLADLDRRAFEPMWRYPAELHRRLIARRLHVRVAESSDQVVAYSTSEAQAGRGQIIRIVVQPEWRRRRIAARLLADAMAFFRAANTPLIMLNTQTENTAARRLYEQWGFKRMAEEVPVLVMQLT